MLKKKRVFGVQFELAYKSEERLLGEALEAVWTRKKIDPELSQIIGMSKSYYIFRSYNQGFNHFAACLPYVSSNLQEVIKVVEFVSKELSNEFSIYAYLIL